VLKNVLMLDDDGIKQMKDQITKEKESGEIETDDEEEQQ
jgi:hypothetical protein